jgi:hypothetical protein
MSTSNSTQSPTASVPPWVFLSGAPDVSIVRLLEARVAGDHSAGLYTASDEQQIGHIQLPTSRAAFVTSPERLERLRRLCQIYSVHLRPEEITSHRKVIGPFIVAAKKAFFRLLEGLLGRSIKHQRDFNSEVVALLTDLCNEAKR